MSQVRQGTHPHPEVARPVGPEVAHDQGTALVGGGRGRRAWAQDTCPPCAVSQATQEATYAAIVAPGCGWRQAGVCEASNFSSPLSLGWGTPLSSQKQGPALNLWRLLQWLKEKLSLYPTRLPILQSLRETWCHLPGLQNLGSWRKLAETRGRTFPPNPAPSLERTYFSHSAPLAWELIKG